MLDTKQVLSCVTARCDGYSDERAGSKSDEYTKKKLLKVISLFRLKSAEMKTLVQSYKLVQGYMAAGSGRGDSACQRVGY
jgi:hypothetical protein